MVNIKISLRQVQLFVLAALSQNLTRVAEQVHLTVPAVSKQLKLLESTYGVTLFEKSGNRIALTADGKRLLPAAKRLLSEIRVFDYQLASLSQQPLPSLSLNVVDTYQQIVFAALQRYRNTTPGLQLDMTVQRWVDQEKILERHGLEQQDTMYITAEAPVDLKVFQAHHLLHMKMVAVVSPKHPLAKMSTIGRHELKQADWLVSRAGAASCISLRDYIDHLQPESVFVLSSFESIKQALIAGMGVSMLPDKWLSPAIKAGELVRIDAKGVPDIGVDLVLLHDRQMVLTQQHVQWMQYLQDYCETPDTGEEF